jgi:hypothetical protein
MPVNVNSPQTDEGTKNVPLANLGNIPEGVESTDRPFAHPLFNSVLFFAKPYKYDFKDLKEPELFLQFENAPISFAALKELDGKMFVYVTGREKKILEVGDKFVIKQGKYGDIDMPFETVLEYKGDGVLILGVENEKGSKSLKVVNYGDKRLFEEDDSSELLDLVEGIHFDVLSASGLDKEDLPFAPTAVARPRPGFVPGDIDVDQFSPNERMLLAQIDELKTVLASQNEKIAEQDKKLNDMSVGMADSLSVLFEDVKSISDRLKIKKDELADLENTDSKKEEAA